MKVAVLGSGAGALAVAADMSRHGRRTVMAELHRRCRPCSTALPAPVRELFRRTCTPGAPRDTLSGMANDCPVLMVLLWCLSVNDDVRLHDGAPAAQGRESCLEWDCP